MKNIFKNRIIRILFLSFIVVGLLTQTDFIHGLFKNNSTTYATGDLTIDWGFVSNKAIFKITNFLPGDSEFHTVKITNDAHTSHHLGLQSQKTYETGNFSQALRITVYKDSLLIFGPQKLSEFFAATSGPGYLDFSTLSPGQSAEYKFVVDFPANSTNEYQGKTVIFNLTVGVAFEVPAECKVDNRKYDNVIFGSEKRDILNGTNGNDIILGLEGDDIINGSNGNDCLIGGPGNDTIDGSNGDDIILGEDGNDRINGSNGNDKIYGGNGNDIIDANNGNDYIDAGDGNDKVDGGNGDDIIYAGAGNDIIDGSNGNDKIYGGEGDDTISGVNGNDYIEGGPGNDTLKGGNGNDTLLGGDGTDSATGDLGTDRCEAEVKKTCEL